MHTEHRPDAVIVQTREQPTHSVIWLHGLGADGHDFEPIVPELIAPHWPGLRFVFPHAPVRPITLNNGYPMRAWYDITALDFEQRREDEAGIRASVDFLSRCIEAENARGIADARIFLAGFSQGGAIALACALRHPRALAGVIALSTYLPLAETSRAEMSAQATQQDWFLAHGRQDPVIPLRVGAASRDALRELGVMPQWQDYPMPHSVCAEEVADLRAWMDTRLQVA